MNRREFFQRSIPAILLPQLINGFSIRALASSPAWLEGSSLMEQDRVLVLIQLSGGNDGLNMVIPLEFYDAYYMARTNIAIPREKVLSLEGHAGTGLHPAMGGLQNMFRDGKLSIVQGVSYPQPNFSHFRATDIWLTGADSGQVLPTGWAGRYLDRQFPRFPAEYPNKTMPDPLAIQIGSLVSPALQGPGISMGMAITNPDSFYNLIDERTDPAPATRAGDQIAYIRAMSMKTDQYSDVIRQAAHKVIKQSDHYPAPGRNSLADQLKIVARLVAGGLRTPVYMVSMSGFDTHARQTDQADTTAGKHASLLGKLSEAIEAFQSDLEFLQVDRRVMGMTFSEFGRRIRSNASGGTDHGAAAPVLVFGSAIQPGIIGNNPTLPPAATVNDNVTMQYDFRSLYAAALEDWLHAGGDASASILGRDFAHVPLVSTTHA